MAEENTVSHVGEIEDNARRALGSADNLQQLGEWRITYLGRRGQLTQILRGLGHLSSEERRSIGAMANEAKRRLEEGFTEKEQALKEAGVTLRIQRDAVDVSLPGWPMPIGGLHPITLTVRRICNIFASMGFEATEGPEVEWDHYNFEMLNIPKHHPARDMFSTLWIDQIDKNGEYPMLLRTHTSPMQIRVMEKTGPPVRVIVPGRVFRYEATDATHEWHFSQVEGLAVDEGVTFADLKGTLYSFVQRLFGHERQIRFRCDYFPFVEPGVDVSIDCFACSGNGCRICGDSGWIEIMGAGMVHPRVLEGVGYDPSVYTGFAFGMGVERIAMLKHGIDDIRLFYSNDLRFLRQF